VSADSFRLLRRLVERSLALRKALLHFSSRWKRAPEFASMVPNAGHRTLERGCGAQG
jgi:hypothetical protein